ANRYATG
ncbi:hypothetical protein D018_1316B, partial [Vibrio parahaemolyticus VP2007-007]